MKILFIIFLFIFSFYFSFSQSKVGRAGPANTVVDQRLGAAKNFYPPVYSDTTQANIGGANMLINNIGIDSCGAVIFTRSPQAFWQRWCSPKRWVRIGIGSDSSSTNITNIFNTSVVNTTIINQTDSSVTIQICTGIGACDTITFATTIQNLSNVYFANDSTIVACATDTVTAVTTCDTFNIPKQKLYVFQNGVNQSAAGLVEFGSNSPISNLQHNTNLNAEYFKLFLNGKTVYDYPYQFYQQQDFGNSSGVVSFLNRGGAVAGQIDVNNIVKLGINYSGKLYGVSSPGYFGNDKIGYWIGVNGTANGSGGIRPDNSSSKFSALLFNTLDTANRDIFIFYGKHPPNTFGAIAPISIGGTLSNYEILALNDTGDIRLKHYPITRNNGGSSKALSTDANGNVKLITVSTGSSVTVIDNRHIQVCNGNNNCDTITTVIDVSNVFVVNDTMLVVCNVDTTTHIESCDTLVLTSGAGFDRGFFEPDQFQFNDTRHVATGNFEIDSLRSFVLYSNKFIANSNSYSYFSLSDNDIIYKSVDNLGNGSGLFMDYNPGNSNIDIVSSQGVNYGRLMTNNSFVIIDQNAGNIQMRHLLNVNADTAILVKNLTTNEVHWRGVSSLLSLTADNGLTANTSTNVQLGGTLLKNTSIDVTTTNYTFNFNRNGSRLLYINTGPSGISPSFKFGDIDQFNNGTYLEIRDNDRIGQIVGGGHIGLYTNFTNDTYGLGDVGNSAGGTMVYVDNTNSNVTIGWLSSVTGNKTKLKVDRSNQRIDFIDNTTTRFSFNTATGAAKFNNYGIGTFTGTATKTLQVDASGNVIEGSFGGGILANNGLTRVADSVQLGSSISGAGNSPLLHTTYINAGSLYTLNVTGSNNDNLFIVTSTGGEAISIYGNNTGSPGGVGVQGNSTNNVGVYGTGGSIGIQAQSTSGTALYALSGTGYGGYFLATPSSTNTQIGILKIERQTSGTAADGIGATIDLNIETASGAISTANQLIYKWTTAANATRTSQFSITGVNSGTATNLISWGGGGSPQYTVNVVSGASNTITLNSAYLQVFSGSSGTTWTLPAIGNIGLTYIIKNRGSAAITLNSNGGGNDIYTTSAVSSLTINAGESYILSDDGTKWIAY
jgi:hypothetical protein